MDVLFEHPRDEEISYPPMPHAIFSNPQVAGVGKTEDELKEDGVEYVVGLNHYKNSAMGDALLSERGFVKLMFEKHSRKLLGAHIIGPEASDMIHMCIAYITMKATLDDMLAMIYVHPALPENVRNACRKAKATQISLWGRNASLMLDVRTDGQPIDQARKRDDDHFTPQLLYRSPVDYPEEAKKNGLEGEVHVLVYIDTFGIPVDTRIAKSTASPILEDEAVKSAMKCLFSPSKSGFQMAIPYEFKLENEDAELPVK